VSSLDDLSGAAEPALAAHAVPDPQPARFADAGLAADREFVLEAVYEGYLAHYGEPRAFERMDPDLSLLAGDTLYALGLERLAAAGDLVAVDELAAVIAACACAEAEQRRAAVDGLWEGSASRLARVA
jgi:hypothetical protein